MENKPEVMESKVEKVKNKLKELYHGKIPLPEFEPNRRQWNYLQVVDILPILDDFEKRLVKLEKGKEVK